MLIKYFENIIFYTLHILQYNVKYVINIYRKKKMKFKMSKKYLIVK